VGEQEVFNDYDITFKRLLIYNTIFNLK